MAMDTRGETTDIESVEDQTGDPAHPATDERLESVRQQGQNGDMNQVVHTTDGTNPEQVESYPVPDGHGLLVQGYHGNSGAAFVGDSDTQEHKLGPRESVTVDVRDSAEVYVRTPNAGDGVVLTWVSL
jgi:hypothetical protein